ncbi:MAG TPA: nickel pincer cofactor biosynthesis protein LarB [Candidatus Thermoplasmatota archaeon]|nr:nickel pincer cofactor biosynthesis protein LarB [Candidatus Thermoplasmatota archaeon]
MPARRRTRPSLTEAARWLRSQSILDVGHLLRLDLQREERTGVPEVVIAEGKRPQAVRAAARGFLDEHGRAIITRCPPGLVLSGLGAKIERHPGCGVVVLRRTPRRAATGGRVAIITGGASDARVAEEADVIARELGCEVRREEDVGVAALSRVLAALERLAPWRPDCYIVCAGREGALAPVVAGLVNGPVIGVPVSTGYGYRGRGEAALSTMLQSCSPLVTVNIDAGFVAAAVASQIAHRAARAAKP